MCNKCNILCKVKPVKGSFKNLCVIEITLATHTVLIWQTIILKQLNLTTKKQRRKWQTKRI
jgi:hypothetical protein